MILFGRLNRYIAKRFALTIAVIILAVFFLIFIIDFVEQMRKFGEHENFTGLTGLTLAAMRAPSIIQDLMPFIVLAGALVLLINLSRRSELVVARASGRSAWSFLTMPVIVAAIVGALSTTVLNPLATATTIKATAIEQQFRSTKRKAIKFGIWFRQNSPDGPSIVHAATTSDEGTVLNDVRVFAYDRDDRFSKKIEAERAVYQRRAWHLEMAEVAAKGEPPVNVDKFVLPTHLSRNDVRHILTLPEDLSFWMLPDFIDTARQTGINIDRFRLAYHQLLAQPLFLIAMVAIAATVSLRLSRHGGTGRLAITGIAAGFLLYVAMKIISDLGRNGIIDPVLSAWVPSIVALTFGTTVLLIQEDG